MNPFASIGKLLLSPVGFLREVVVELKQVTWPTRKETIRSTILVIAISVGVGVYIAGLDLVFTKAIGFIFSLKN